MATAINQRSACFEARFHFFSVVRKPFKRVHIYVEMAGIEPATLRLKVGCSWPLSYISKLWETLKIKSICFCCSNDGTANRLPLAKLPRSYHPSQIIPRRASLFTFSFRSLSACLPLSVCWVATGGRTRNLLHHKQAFYHSTMATVGERGFEPITRTATRRRTALPLSYTPIKPDNYNHLESYFLSGLFCSTILKAVEQVNAFFLYSNYQLYQSQSRQLN